MSEEDYKIVRSEVVAAAKGPIAAALAFANDSRHGGAGYTLHLSLVGGSSVVGAYVTHGNGWVALERHADGCANRDESQWRFYGTEHIVSARVVW